LHVVNLDSLTQVPSGGAAAAAPVAAGAAAPDAPAAEEKKEEKKEEKVNFSFRVHFATSTDLHLVLL
jgi:ribosomal protein L12E/L44/L45/RPP1/RPP2